jgi:hypothetical protein
MANKKISAEDWSAIEAQIKEEIMFARKYKQGKVKRTWQPNEDLYYSRGNYNDFYYTNGVSQTPVQQNSRANVDLGQMAGFVHTILSKIDNPLIFKFVKRKLAQLRRVMMLNALRVADQDKNDWEIKDIVGKKQAIIYGRAIYSYFAESENGYEAHLDNVDVYDFLIDPSAGGVDIERAMYLGDYGVVKTRQQLEKGMKGKGAIYDSAKTKTLLEGDGNATEINQEETNKRRRTMDQNIFTADKELDNKDKFKFWRWGTTYKGERYYALYSDKGGVAIELCTIDEKFESKLWWYWTWAAFPDLTEFWTPSFCDYVRHILLAQAVSINQLLDNAEQINKPQKIVQVGAIENMAEIRYRRDGIIRVKKGINADQALQIVKTTPIDTPIAVFNLLDKIRQVASGVTDQVKGANDPADGEQPVTAAATKDNASNSADLFGYLNKSYAFGYKRFAKLWALGVREHLIKRIAIDILGPDGVETIQVSRRDIFRKDEDFNVMVESSSAELDLSRQDKEIKLKFLHDQEATQNQQGAQKVQNSQKAYEIQAEIAGFSPEQIRELLDMSDYGAAQIMSQADRDIEALMDGEKVIPNPGATLVYKQRIVDYMTMQSEDINNDQFQALAEYVMSLDAIIVKNMIRQANDQLLKMKAAQIAAATANPQPLPAATPATPQPVVAPGPSNLPPQGAAPAPAPSALPPAQ